ncbi:MAG: DnaD domain protein [Firmicutes bacterium]|nr:DnaD domain protein [Bacillota bacterium]
MRQAGVVYPLDDRRDFSIIYDELWDCYLPYLGPAAALLYCFLMRSVRQGLAGPMGPHWAAEVCAPLGLSVPDSHQAWARLQEMGLVIANSDGSYSLVYPKTKAEFQQAFADLAPRQQQFLSVAMEPSIKADAQARRARRSRAQKTLYLFVEQEFGRALTSTEAQKLAELEKKYPRELVEVAVEMAIIAQAFSLAYVEQVLLNWQVKGITTAQAAREEAERHRLQKARRGTRSKARTAPKSTAERQDDLDLYRLRPTRPVKED